ncbi:hypothetical protein NYZ99_20150 [Maribacter litopenaei]|uniref:TonB-dependent receptor n=1 Tax=Maribacter litopenaei TaxID=2976127 RepID=A0ABY5Y7Y5_9FLAO|nr:hypothetical protein [Maribacter litopenaei]UWX54993.1 hypothetical protein NYZ99_20150 [Maribacter litopenaei]
MIKSRIRSIFLVGFFVLPMTILAQQKDSTTVVKKEELSLKQVENDSATLQAEQVIDLSAVDSIPR